MFYLPLKSDRFGMEIIFKNLLKTDSKELKSDRFGMEI